MPHGADSPYISHFLALRDGSMKMLALGSTEGLIVFPSFHTVMSVLMILALRGCGPMFWLGGFVQHMLILMTVPLDGGHYLADMVAGILVAVLVWAALFQTAKRVGSAGPINRDARYSRARHGVRPQLIQVNNHRLVLPLVYLNDV